MRTNIVFGRIAMDFKTLSLVLAGAAVYACYTPLFGEYIETMNDRYVNVENAPAQEPPLKHDWNKIESDYFTVYYRPEADLKFIERRLKKRGVFASWGRPLDSLTEPESRIGYRLDTLFERVMEMLDMRPSRVKIIIKIFKDRDELAEEYMKIFGAASDMKSFYIHRHKTIYTSEDDISDSLLAHEMGHAVVDHYFPVLPPAKVAELLASYVDMHLDEF